jgi:hypothetical protein
VQKAFRRCRFTPFVEAFGQPGFNAAEFLMGFRRLSGPMGKLHQRIAPVVGILPTDSDAQVKLKIVNNTGALDPKQITALWACAINMIQRKVGAMIAANNRATALFQNCCSWSRRNNRMKSFAANLSEIFGLPAKSRQSDILAAARAGAQALRDIADTQEEKETVAAMIHASFGALNERSARAVIKHRGGIAASRVRL